jgi:PAS domain S-box-containing protein
MGARRERNGYHDQSTLEADHGHERRGLSRQGFISALHPADQKRVVETIEHSLHTADLIDVECCIRTSSGDWRWIHSRGAPRRDETGKIIRWYGSADDIDAQKRLEEELRIRAGEGNFPRSDIA